MEGCAAVSSAFSVSSRSVRRAQRARFLPSLANSRAIPWPRPELAPVMRMFFRSGLAKVGKVGQVLPHPGDAGNRLTPALNATRDEPVSESEVKIVTSVIPGPMGQAPIPRRRTRSGELHIVRDDIAGLLAHDLRTPLSAIAMNLDFVLGELEGTEAESVRAALED